MYTLMVVPNNFPEGDAGAVRDNAFAHIYKEMGYDTYIISGSTRLTGGEYSGIKFYSTYMSADNSLQKIVRYIKRIKLYKKYINSIIDKNGPPSLIHINHIPESVVNYLVLISEKFNIPIVHDSVEWYSSCQFTLKFFDKAYLLKDRLNKHIIKKPIRVYAISTYLEKYFRSRGLDVLRIPVIMDIGVHESTFSSSDKIVFTYAGSPAKKDSLKEIVMGVELLSEEEKQHIIVNIVGVNENDIFQMVGKKQISKCIIVHGRVPRKDVMRVLHKSDFSLLLRPAEERHAKAAFPTKVVEAMSNGVAMLCNISSDLGMYLKDMDNAVIAKGNSAEDMCSAIKRVLKLDRQKIDTIKENAHKCAIDNFDYRLWVDSVEKFIRS